MKKPFFSLSLRVYVTKSNNSFVLLNPYKLESLKGFIPNDERIVNQGVDCRNKNIPFQPIIVNFTHDEWGNFEKEVKSKVNNIQGIPAELYYGNIAIVFLNKPE